MGSSPVPSFPNPDATATATGSFHHPATATRADDHLADAWNEILVDLDAALHPGQPAPDGSPVFLPALRPDDLGDPGFRREHRLRYAYMAGAMANGIASVELVEALANAGMLGSFGAAGLPPDRVERAVERLQRSLGHPSDPDRKTHAFNLIHSPSEPAVEAAVADLYLRRGVDLVEASAYMDLTLPVVRYRVRGVRTAPDGSVHAPNRLIAKVSRVEVAARFLSPPPERFLRELVALGEIDEHQARLAARVPMADDVTAEADSGGHTDNQPAITLYPTILAARDRLWRQYAYARRPRVGAAGGISTPEAAAAALAMGADYLVTGSVNQACLESGSSEPVRRMLAEARQGDVAMAPAADMFEMGVKVQVLKRGTMFAMRAARLYELYRTRPSLEDLEPGERATLEKTLFKRSIEQVWEDTRAFFAVRDPARVELAERDPRLRMALVFRWYLGLSSRWANDGVPDRALDYQIWCGPAMAAFNDWTRGSFLERPERRQVATVAWNILRGAAVLARAAILRAQGVELPPGAARVVPVQPPPDELRPAPRH